MLGGASDILQPQIVASAVVWDKGHMHLPSAGFLVHIHDAYTTGICNLENESQLEEKK